MSYVMDTGKLIVRVFVSMPFKNKSEEYIRKCLNYAENYYRSQTEYLHDDDEVHIVCNWYDENNAPDYVRNPNVSKRIMDLSQALEKMATCDEFILITNPDGSIPFGCNLEMIVWINSSSVRGLKIPMIINGGLIK